MKFYRKKTTFLIITVFCIVIILFILIFSYSKIRPIVNVVAKSKLDYLANKIVNASVEKHFENVSYSDIVNIVFTETNNVSAVSINFSHLNTLKSKIMLDISQELENLKETEMKIPLGNFLGSEFLMGTGPKITFKLVPYGTVYIDFRDQFTCMGINQTVHEIYLDVKTGINAIIPGIKTTSFITTTVMVAHTVIVGDVPENYTGVNEIQGQVEDYILDVLP